MLARLGAARSGGLLALALAVALLPLALGNQYLYDVAILVGLNAIVCVGLNLLIGYAGQISLGHAGFFALGGYGSAILAVRYGWPPLATLPASVGSVTLLAFLIGRPILRLKGHYLAMATLGLGVIITVVLATADRFTGGPDGMSVPPLALLRAVRPAPRGRARGLPPGRLPAPRPPAAPPQPGGRRRGHRHRQPP